jgi:cytochrome c5
MKWKHCHLNARLSLLALAVAALVASGCSSTAPRRGASVPSEESTEAKPSVANAKGGAQLWSETCSRCHFARDPGAFSRSQWDVIMLHMRVRANLTTEEHQTILEFLKSAN